jgi:putative transposase
MPRKPLQRSNLLPYHITARANNRERFPLPLEEIWEVITNECLVLSLVYEVEFHALVLMPNHFHMLVTTPVHELGDVMDVFMTSIARTVNLNSGRLGHLFGGPYYGSVIGNSRYFGHALKYVYRNPVKAKLSQFVEDYPYSTLRGLLGYSALPFPIHFTRTPMDLSLPIFETDPFLSWLNKPFPIESEDRIRKGLKRRIFDRPIDRKTRTRCNLLEQFL